MNTFAWIATSREATILYDLCFIFALMGLYLVQKKRLLNYFQRYGLYLLFMGLVLRIVCLSLDYAHMLITNTHFIQQTEDVVPHTFKLDFFIKQPEVLFEFPLFAIGLDWLELALILGSTSELTSEAYLKTHKRLQYVFFVIAGLLPGCDAQLNP